MTNVRIKHYLKDAQINVASYACYGKEDLPRSKSRARHSDPDRSAEQSRARARRAVTDIALCNPFTHMFTLTFDKTYVDRYDPKEIYAKLSNYLRERVRNEDFLYVCVPEYHKDKAIHIHGLGCFERVQLVRATHYKWQKPLKDKQGRPVYNIPSWIWGWSEVTPITSEAHGAAAYCTEYINKDNEKIFGKWYLSARACVKKPHIVDCLPVEFNDAVDEVKLAVGDQWIINPSKYLFILQERVPYPDGAEFNVEEGKAYGSGDAAPGD